MSHIQKSTFDFLRELKDNNSREWFADNRSRYEGSLEDVRSFLTDLIAALSEFDPRINTSIQANKCLFRIYRDTRFSNDKTPYKSWFGAGISVDGRKLHGPEYYIHIGAENSFIACGYWRPEKSHLEAIRQEIDYNGAQLEKILKDVLTGKKINLFKEDLLKRAPAGYGEDNPNIHFIKLKSFVLDQSLTMKELSNKNALNNIVASYKNMLPFKEFLQEAIDTE
ncbi:DUF2461 domain-containing protein [Sphingobacterium sp. N143]|uniref:DUF2461 domain-containing protein n=1 Tax=Sphingobacterium sp. N143 TaxID=2746727 RepID=UPI002574E606|nr:DUF2461 domain-containing protein [Sphingobacterium sp. N143]MDM1296082.1 DUF2461 domain-containing protein [Sphingobacterium sp. N143]